MALDLMHAEFFPYLIGIWFCKNVIIFGANMSSSVYVDRKSYILVIRKDSTQGLDDTTMIAEKEYSVNYNGVNSYIFVNGVEIYKFKAKDSETNAAPLCLGSVSRDFSVDNIKKTGLYGYVYDIQLIMRLLMLRYKTMFGFNKKCLLDY